MQLLFLSIIISLTIQFVFGSIAVLQRSDKVTDLSYSLSFVILAISNLLIKEQSTFNTVLNIMVIIWGLRLGAYLFIRINKIKKDSRFDGIRENPRKFISFWLFQAISVPIIMLPVTVFSNNNEPDQTSIILIALWVLGLLIETLADAQKFRFKNDPENKGLWISSGLWKFSRHPNYFGELLMWWAIFSIVISNMGMPFVYTIVGPLYISVLILFITGIPTLERRYAQKYSSNKEFATYKMRTRLLLPIPKFSIKTKSS